MSLRGKHFVAIVATPFLLGACGTGNPHPVPTVTVTVTQAVPASPSVPGLNRPEPGSAQISKVQPDGSFDAVPNFKYFGLAPCDTQLCNIAVFPNVNPPEGTPLMNIDGHPIEGGNHHPSDAVHVLCQVITEKSVRDNHGHNSTVQDLVKIPAKFLTSQAKKRYLKSDGYALGFTSDIWLGNTGVHRLCTQEQIDTNTARH
jgi:hypothetical protein